MTLDNLLGSALERIPFDASNIQRLLEMVQRWWTERSGQGR